jgi:hypothetical protein
VRKADNLTAICVPILEKLWEPRRLTTLRASTVCYRDCLTFLFFLAIISASCGRVLNDELPEGRPRPRSEASL